MRGEEVRCMTHGVDGAGSVGVDRAYEAMSRRSFLRAAGVCAAGFGGLRVLSELGGGEALAIGNVDERFGRVVREIGKEMNLPRGFTSRVISRAGAEMADGLVVPALPDGMWAFPHATREELTVLVRNHENRSAPAHAGPSGADRSRLGKVERSDLFDAGHGRWPALGGTTNVVYNTETGRVEREFLSLAGTNRNCAGGATPWGTWLTCEEDVTTPDERHERSHGWVFEVTAHAEPGLVEAKPIEGMGRFNHEAVAVDPRTSIVYLTEDRPDGLLYRFVPSVKGDMHAGGRLPALAVVGERSRDLRNWESRGHFGVGTRFECEWVDVDGIDAPDDNLRLRGFEEKGAARFARLEGIVWGDGAAYVICTTGGHLRKGQVFRYTPSRFEGAAGERDAPAALELFVEPNDPRVLNMPDNCCVAPWGDLIVCEDNGTDETRLVGVTPAGTVYDLARNAMSRSEFAGVCFSPDGSTMFVNMQYDGLTLAVRGPWPS